MKALTRHRLRTGLAISGTGLGVAALLVMVAVGEGAEQEIAAEIEALGGNLLLVLPERVDPLVGRSSRGSLAETLQPEDAEAIAALPSVAYAAASREAPLQVKYGILSISTSVRATTSEYQAIRDFQTVRGRYFTDQEAAEGRRVTVIGSRVAEQLFDGVDPIGRHIRVERVPFEVVGVLESKGATANAGSDEDDQILIPLRTGLRRVFNVDYVTLVYVEVPEEGSMDAAERDIASLLRDRHGLDRLARQDDFRIENQLLVLRAEREASASFRRLITALASASLAVGGVGILSIMLLSIRERRNEVGLRIAVGAKRRDVRTQFVVEALILGIAGGLVGLVLGVGMAAIVQNATEWAAVVSTPAIVLAAGSALAVALVFGVLPAQRAAALDPIESLRAE